MWAAWAQGLGEEEVGDGIGGGQARWGGETRRGQCRAGSKGRSGCSPDLWVLLAESKSQGSWNQRLDTDLSLINKNNGKKGARDWSWAGAQGKSGRTNRSKRRAMDSGKCSFSPSCSLLVLKFSRCRRFSAQSTLKKLNSLWSRGR